MVLIVSYSGMAFCPACIILLVYSWGERVGKAKIISYSLPSNNNENKTEHIQTFKLRAKIKLSTEKYSMIPQMTKVSNGTQHLKSSQQLISCSAQKLISWL